MKTYIALLRGINVLGNSRLPMADLKQLVQRWGAADVQTYIQSGNVVFRSATADVASLARELADGILKRHGFRPRVLVLTDRQLAQAATKNPFMGAARRDPTSVHLFFLAERPSKPDLKALEAVKTTERFGIDGKTFYLHTPDGFGRSKLAARVERFLGVDTTARNWRTVTTLMEMARTCGSSNRTRRAG